MNGPADRRPVSFAIRKDPDFMDERFLRNEMLWGPKAQARLAQAHVIVFGLGGVGSYAAECLARSGIGELTLVDSDTVASPI